MAKEKVLPGFPQPADSVIENREAIASAFDDMHAALVEAFESAPPGSVISIARKVKGDEIKVSFKPGNQA